MFASKFGAHFIETSAKNGENVTLLFETIVRTIREQEIPNKDQEVGKDEENKICKTCNLI